MATKKKATGKRKAPAKARRAVPKRPSRSKFVDKMHDPVLVARRAKAKARPAEEFDTPAAHMLNQLAND